MRAGAAKKKAADRRFVARPIENGTHGEKLIECELAVKNVAAGEAVGGFEILGGDDLDAFNQAGKIGRVRGESLDDGVAEFLAAGGPRPLLFFLWSAMRINREGMPSVGRERRN